LTDNEKRKKDAEIQTEIYDVIVTMEITRGSGERIDSKKIDFGKLKEDQVKGLTDLFSMMAANIEYLKKLAPQFERLDKSKPGYLK
jgi:Zn-finger domain-containing protein